MSGNNVNNQRHRGFFHPRFIQDILRNIGPHFNAQEEDDDTDMPPLEPIERFNSSPIVSPINPPASSSQNAETAPSTGANPSARDYNNDDDTMPDLQSISDSSESGSESDADEVEMMQDLQPVDDDNDSSWTDDDNNNQEDPDDEDEMPALESVGARPAGFRSSNRRARVDDDDDEDRDRRHPSQRTSNDEPNNNNTNNEHQSQPQPVPQPPPQHQHAVFNIPGFVHIVSRGPVLGTNPDGTADTFQLFQRLFGGATNANQPRPQQAGTPPTNPNAGQAFGGFTVTFGTGPTPGGQFPHGPLPQVFNFIRGHTHTHGTPPGAPGQGPGAPGQGPGGAMPLPEDMVDVAMFADLMARFGVGLGQALGREEQEDPERAKKLVAGLEEVPAGLVRRMERVGGAPGGHVDASVGASGSGETADVPGCAICWDRLLDAEGDGFVMKEGGGADKEKEVEVEVEGSTGGQSQTESSTNASTKAEPTEPVIVSLPCAHVFHASCLLPWFSRPRQTTCPTCRFNVDPENLTFVRRPPRRASQGPFEAPVQEAGVNMPGANVNTGDTNVGAQPTPEMHVHIVELGGPGPAPAAQHQPGPTPEPNANTNAPPPNVNSDAAPNPDPNAPNANSNAPNANPNAPNGNPNGEFWTFGIDMIFENEEGDDVDMEGEGPEETEMRQAEDLAQEFMVRNGPPPILPTFNFGPAGADHAPAANPPPTGTDDPGARLGVFAQVFGVGGNGTLPAGGFAAGNGGNGAFPAGNGGVATGNGGFAAGNFGFAAGGFPAGNAGQGGGGPTFGDFMQMFEGVMGGAGASQAPDAPGVALGATPGAVPGAIPGAAPATQVPAGNMPTTEGLAAFSQFFGGVPIVPVPGPIHAHGPHIHHHHHHHHHPPPPTGRRQKKPWSLPAAPGPTLRQRVEQKEREAGLRCFDMSCGMGPSDEEPFATMSDAGMKQLSIRPSSKRLSVGMGTSMCAHTFHPSCLISAVRVALRGAAEEVVGDEVVVSCPNCRAAGCISKVEWEEGVKALM